MRKRYGEYIYILLFLCSCFIWGALSPRVVFADDCNNLSKNKTYMSKMAEMGNYIKEKDWRNALAVSKGMEKICDRMPLLNYNIAKIYQQLGNEEQYLYYLKKALDKAREFEIDWDLLDKMYTEKYLVAHPEAVPSAIEAREAELEELKNQVREQGSSQDLGFEIVRRHYAFGMWTGVAFAGVGVVLAGAGAGLAFTNDDQIEFKGNEAKASVKMKDRVYTGMLVGGALLAVAGATVAGIMGYYYAQLNKPQSEPGVSFQVSPVSAGMTVQF